ncbi:MAG: 50S ribosomal protein L25 [Verrucomicrobiales bacterium]|nr:50S ribosomal protein L25 [Verrucomicrobiales bacterium]
MKKLRGQGRVPTVIYGGKTAAQTLELNQRELDKLIAHSASENILVDLAIEGDARPARLALVQEVQHDPISGKVLHIDFHEVSPNEKVTVMVPVETTGTPIGVKDGGVLEHVLHKLKVRALPADLPEILLVDVTSMGMDKVLHLGEIPVPPGVELLGDKNVPVLSVAAPRAEVEETPAEGAAPAAGEVEMIKEKKGDEAAPAGDAKDAKKPEKAADKAAEKPAKEKK